MAAADTRSPLPLTAILRQGWRIALNLNHATLCPALETLLSASDCVLVLLTVPPDETCRSNTCNNTADAVLAKAVTPTQPLLKALPSVAPGTAPRRNRHTATTACRLKASALPTPTNPSEPSCRSSATAGTGCACRAPPAAAPRAPPRPRPRKPPARGTRCDWHDNATKSGSRLPGSKKLAHRGLLG